MAGRYGRGVYTRNLSVYSPHSATTLGGVHTFRHIEKKHSNETRERTNCWENLQAKIVRWSSSPDHSFLVVSSSYLKMYTVFQVCSAESSEVGLLSENMCIALWLLCLSIVWSKNHPKGAFILLRALWFFLHSAFPFLHCAFLILHSAFLKFAVWVSTCVFSLIVSQPAILFILVQLLFQFLSMKRLSLD